MRHEVSKIIDAPVERAWDLLARVQCWPRWGPSVSAVDCPDDIIRFGSQGRVRTRLGLWLPFRVIEFQPSRYWRWRVAGVTATGHRVESLGQDRCRVTFDMPFWAAPYGVVCRTALDRIACICAARGPDRR